MFWQQLWHATERTIPGIGYRIFSVASVSMFSLFSHAYRRSQLGHIWPPPAADSG
jgi:hypothetical protein